jgi:hypothetical protein
VGVILFLRTGLPIESSGNYPEEHMHQMNEDLKLEQVIKQVR